MPPSTVPEHGALYYLLVSFFDSLFASTISEAVTFREGFLASILGDGTWYDYGYDIGESAGAALSRVNILYDFLSWDFSLFVYFFFAVVLLYLVIKLVRFGIGLVPFIGGG